MKAFEFVNARGGEGEAAEEELVGGEGDGVLWPNSIHGPREGE